MKLVAPLPLSSDAMSRAAAGITVPMTEAQWRRHDMQVRWLREAIAAQMRAPDDETYDRATLRISRARR